MIKTFTLLCCCLLITVAASAQYNKMLIGNNNKGQILNAGLNGAIGDTLNNYFGVTPHSFYDADVDPVNKKFYMAWYYGLYEMNFDGSGFDTLVYYNPGGYSNGIAVDHVNGLLYWGDTPGKKIHRSNLDGSNDTVLITVGGYLSDVDIDPVHGYLFYGQWIFSGFTGLYRANLDGSNPTALVTSYGVRGLEPDIKNQRIYLVTDGSVCRRIDYSYSAGTDTVLFNFHSGGFFVDTVNDKLYTSDITGNRILSSDLNGGNVEVLIPPGILFNPFGPLLYMDCSPTEGFDIITACDSLTWIDGITYYADNNTAVYTATNTEGCDSIITLNLTINHSSTRTDVLTTCDSLVWIDGITYTSDNSSATYTLTNAAGCDSIITLNLTINHSSTGTDALTTCDSLVWIDGITYTSDNSSATYTLTNAAGCDSVVTLNLTVNHSNTGTDVITACDSLVWIDGITYTSDNSSATYTLTNAAGCDSVVTLNLTVNHSNTGTDVITACDSLVWIDGITYTSDNSSATYTLTNAAGCDSVVTLNLTVNYSTTGTDVITACDSLVWIDGIPYTADNSSATYTLTNATGCDSVVTLNLTVNYSTTGTDVLTACDSLVWIDGVTYTADNNTATYTLTNAAGCDSVVTLNLTINTVDASATKTGSTLMANTASTIYQWLDCADGYAAMLNDTLQSYMVEENGSYAVEVSLNGCIDTSTCFDFTDVAVMNIESGKMLQIFPNPNNGSFTITPRGAGILEINDATGRQVYHARLEKGVQFSNLSLSKGLYLVRFISEDRQSVQRMIVN